MTSEQVPKPPRKRGAPYGNTNALVHGYYSRFLRMSPAPEDAAAMKANLDGEIILLRAFLRLVTRLANQGEPLSVDQQITFLRVVTLTANTLARLVHAQQLVELAADPRSGDHSQAMADLAENGLLPPIYGGFS